MDTSVIWKSSNLLIIHPWGNGKKFPRIQVLTVQDLFDGKRPQYLDYDPTGMGGMKKARRETRNAEQNSLPLGGDTLKMQQLDGKEAAALSYAEGEHRA